MSPLLSAIGHSMPDESRYSVFGSDVWNAALQSMLKFFQPKTISERTAFPTTLICCPLTVPSDIGF